MVKKFKQLGTLILVGAMVTTSPAIAAKKEPTKTSVVDILTPQMNPADPDKIAEIDAAIKAGNTGEAKLASRSVTTEGTGYYTDVYPYSFSGVSYTGLQSKTFQITESEVNITSSAHTSNGDGTSGSFTITLYKDGWIDTNLGTNTYLYGPNNYTYGSS